MEIKLTESEIRTLIFYLDKALIDAKGLRSIGFGNDMSVRNLESIKKKISNQEQQQNFN